ncbi:N-acetylgalactosamine kinase isoform X2 [Solenopsis invicta]|uniref:N-acetylgalactosamine kinase isoform X2 n=1 Tax=Solenopsis invicta TaxID=13686 RepID=UPI00193DD383|nr:N-acetylgalactosamine kinase isoform X2 [Solenopsis invicta]
MSHQANRTRITEADDHVPILAPTADISPRLKTLAAHFTSKYKVEPSFYVRVPGRVNLIGEHIDYCGYSVCPMAIEQHILVAVTLSKNNEICLTNVDPKYEDFQCNFENTGSCISDSESGPVWYKYFLCGVKGALEVIPAESVPTGILVAVWGNILPNSGLSSSSALVSAALLSVIHASQCQLSKHELASVSARAERHIGTQGGGMDQAIAFLGKAGSAKLIEFNPLRATDVTLPENAVFVIAHSQAYHNKASTADFNLRVAECRLAAQIIAKKKNIDWKHVQRLIDIQERLTSDLDEMVTIVMTELHKEPYTLDEICECLGTDYEQLKKTSLVSCFNISQTFKLQQRAQHVFQEAGRVLAFRRINEEGSIMEHEKLQHLGNLMSKSHSSLHKLYECSHPNMDALVEKAMLCGAFGARLTGAGWGGCIVAIINKNGVQQFVEALRAYLCQNSTKNQAELEDMVFPTSPNQGAIIYTMPIVGEGEIRQDEVKQDIPAGEIYL